MAYLFEEKRKIGNNNPDHPVFKTVNQLMQHAVGGVHVVETEFTTEGAKAVALVLERTASCGPLCCVHRYMLSTVTTHARCLLLYRRRACKRK